MWIVEKNRLRISFQDSREQEYWRAELLVSANDMRSSVNTNSKFSPVNAWIRNAWPGF